MSAEDRPRREVAHRLFAAEFEDTDYSYAESDEERAPNYVVTPSGARVNRLFVVGVLTEVEQVNDDFLRARVVDPTGAFVVSAGQYQPDALAFLERTEPPAFVAVTGKARTFEPDDGDRVYTSIRPESLNVVTAETRDRWVVGTAEQTLRRIEAFAAATARPERGEDLREALLADGVAEELAAGIPRAMRHYGTSARYLDALRTLALDAARVVAGDREEARPLTVAPDESGGLSFADLAVEVDVDAAPAADATAGAEPAGDEDGVASTADPAGAPSTTEPVQPEPAAETEPSTAASDHGGDPTGDGAAAASADDAPVEAGAADESDPAAGGDGDGEVDVEDGDGEVDVEDGDGEVDVEDVDEALTDEEREAVHEEFDVSFSSGSDIPDAGEADIETPAPAEEVDEADASDAVAAADDAAEPGEDAMEETAADAGASSPATESETDESADDAGEESVDLEDAVVDAMRSVGDGDGAPRAAVVEQVADARGVGADAVEDAIQDALMAGRCYESGEDELTPI
ncbi:MAG: hypothetical protein ABEJ70_02015 [Halobacteriaceae archaeon]